MELIAMMLCWGISGWILGWCIQVDLKEKLQRRMEQEKIALQIENNKLVDHVLWLEHDDSLGGKPNMTLIPDRLPRRDLVLPGGHILPETIAQAVPERSPIDTLLDMLETAAVTGIRSEPYGKEEMDADCHGLKPLVTLEFGDVSVKELNMWTGKNSSWVPDICWKGHPLPKLSKEQAKRMHRIFRDKMAKEAARSLKKPASVEGIAYERDM